MIMQYSSTQDNRRPATEAGTGLFITFEGGEGAGKSTQIKLLAEHLQKQGKSVLLTREPGGCESAELIRELLVQGEKNRWDPLSELLLHFTARREHYVRVIKPSLDQGKIVLCDRFADSTMAYQGYAMGLGREKVLELYRLVLGNFAPNLTLVFDMDPKLGLERAHSRQDTENRYEKMGTKFHQQIREAFLDIAEREPSRVRVVDAGQSVEQIHLQVVDFIIKIV